MASYEYKLVPAMTFSSNWEEEPSAQAQLEAFLQREGAAGWIYPPEAIKVRVWVTGKGNRHKHATLEPATGGTHVVVNRRG